MPELSQIYAFLFLMIGPIKIIAPFAKMTSQADAALTRKIAFRGILFASIGLLVAGYVGGSMLSKYGIPLPILALAGGVILFLVALNNVIQQYVPPHAQIEPSETPSLNIAMNPLAFPTIVTPYGIAAVIVFLALGQEINSQLQIAGVVMGIMALNLVIMLFAKKIYKPLAIILPILGVVLSVVQVALGLMIIYNQLKTLLSA